ncbi:MAG: hypothetical protein ABR608_12005 [Pseudonocardiaceae bacterium]
MDEQRLGELFRAAVGEPPPPSFGRAEVVAASRRVTARRRGAVAGSTLLGVTMLTVGLLTSGVLGGGHAQTPIAGQSFPPSDVAAAPELPHTLGTAPSSGTPTPRGGSSRAGCASRDDALASEMTAVLAERGGAVTGPAAEVPGPCPAGSRAAAVPVPGGTLYVLVVPQADPPEQSDLVQSDGRREHALMLDRGRGLVVISMPAVPGQPAPLGEEVPALAQELAKRL